MRKSKTDIVTSICDSMCILSTNKSADKVTITSLINTAGICRSSFYYYFESVDAVFSYMVNQFCQDYLNTLFRVLNYKAIGNTQELLNTEYELCDIVLQKQNWVLFFLQKENYLNFKNVFFSKFRDNCRLMNVSTGSYSGSHSELTRSIAYEYSIYSCCAQMLSILELWSKRSFKESPADFVAIYERTFNTSLIFEPKQDDPW